MSSDETAHPRTLSIRLSERLAADLRRAAAQESNTTSAVARRLIALGLIREQRATLRELDESR